MAEEVSEPNPITDGYARDDSEIEFARVVAFSDGIFAIAITLLVLALEVPQNLAAGDIGEAVLNLEDDFFAYALSFAVVGKFWLSHHRFYGSLERFDGRLMVINLVYLAWVVLVPFSSELIGEYGDAPIAISIYAANLVAASGTFAIQIHYCYRNGLIRRDASTMAHGYSGWGNFIFALFFLVSIPIAFVSVGAAQLIWLASFAVGRPLSGWLARREEERRGRNGITRP